MPDQAQVSSEYLWCLRTCGTKYRGCDPQCPRAAYDRGLQDGVTLEIKRVRKLLDEEPTP